MMSRSARAGVVVGTVVGLFGVLALHGGYGRTSHADPSDRIAEPPRDSYSEFVRTQFIDKGRLVVRSRAGADSETPIVDLADATWDDQVAVQFATQSFLLEDIRRNDPSIWTIENGKVVDISPYIHTPPPPFQATRTWRGDLLFSRQILTNPEDEIVLTPVGWNGPILRFPPNPGRLVTGDSHIGALDLNRIDVTAIRQPVINVFCGAATRPMATISRIGDQIAVNVRSMECKVEVDQRTLEREFAPIGESGRLVFVKDGERLVYDRLEKLAGERLLSTPMPSGERFREPTTASLAEAIERDYVHALPGEPAAHLQDPIRLTLDPQIQPVVQNLLSAYVGKQRSAATRPTIGAITVMDALTGDILALATYPTPEQISSLLPDEDDRRFRAAQHNQNFELLPIGSAAKPLISAAILAYRPDLLTLRLVSENGEVNDLLGMELPAPRRSHGRGSEIGFDQFIQWSDNDYAASLLLLAASDRDNTEHVSLRPGQYYRLGGVRYTWRVKSIFERPDGRGGYVTTSPQSERQLAWAELFEPLFDVSAARRGAQDVPMKGLRCTSGGGAFGDSLRDAGIWRRLFLKRPTLNACWFTESVPYREALSITSARDFRQDLLPVMLGNGEGRWTAVKVAEAYSRIVTGRRVVANLVKGDRTATSRITPDFSARVPLTHALALVVNGTASKTEMPSALVRVRRDFAGSCIAIGAFSKTGTPRIPYAEYQPADKVINWLIRRERLRLDVGGRAAVLASSTGSIPIRDDGAVARELRSDPETLRTIRSLHSSRERVLSRLLEYNRDLARGGSPYIVLRGNLLVRVASRTPLPADEDDPNSEGKVYAVVVGAYRVRATGGTTLSGPTQEVADGAQEPERAYTIVVNLQFQDKNAENAAADLAAQILTGPLRPLLARAKGSCAA